MIFPKAFLAEQLENKIKKEIHEANPFETYYENGDKGPYEHYITNFHTAFDLRSNEMKDLVYKARNEIVETCFKEDSMDLVPNQGRIEECIKRVNYKHYGRHFDRRKAYFGNSIYTK